jgi:hypothetical protein
MPCRQTIPNVLANNPQELARQLGILAAVGIEAE